MNTTSQITILALVAATASAAATLRNGAHKHVHDASDLALDSHKVVVLPEDLQECVDKVSSFLTAPATKDLAVEKATDACAVEHKDDADNYVCPHMRSMLVDAFTSVPKDRKLSPDSFCEITEYHTLRMRGTTRLSSIGSGSIINFAVNISDCQPTVTGAMKPKTEIAAADVGDFWYALCINQDCGHYLQSRTRWCKRSSQPTHGKEVCELARTYTGDAAARGDKAYDAPALCKLYDGFVDQVKEDVTAYDHFIHEKTRAHVPVPKDPPRSLQSSQLLNDVAAHKLRDGQGKYVQPHHSSAGRSSAAATVALLVLAKIMW